MSIQPLHTFPKNSSSQSSPSQSVPPLGCEHIPFDRSLWTGRHEPDESERARYWYQLLDSYDNQRVGLVGFACDQGVRRNLGRVGAKTGPNHIRQAFAKLPCPAVLQDSFISTVTTASTALTSLVGDAGDILCHDGGELAPDTLEQTQAQYAQQVRRIIQQGNLAIGLGGGHAIAYASYQGLWQALNRNELAESNASTAIANPTPSIGIINFDAHLDIRQAPKGTSGTPFRQIAEHCHAHNQPFHYCCIGVSQFSNTAALFDRADELGVTVISDDTCARVSWESIAQQLSGFIAQVDIVYVTIDLDGLPASVMPGVSAPAAKGISLDFVERCLEHIFAQGKVKMADIAELNPNYDIDGRSSKVAARLLALMIEYHLLVVNKESAA
jgi:formiminoglutamase